MCRSSDKPRLAIREYVSTIVSCSGFSTTEFRWEPASFFQAVAMIAPTDGMIATIWRLQSALDPVKLHIQRQLWIGKSGAVHSGSRGDLQS